jgi:DUF2075 family protein
MIRTCFSAILVLCLFSSCHKSELNRPVETTSTFSFFKDEHIALVAFKMEQSAARQVMLTFTTRYEKDVKTIEVYSGTTMKNLCSMYEQKIAGDSHQLKTYQIVDNAAGYDVNFYMLKYTIVGGDWSYSPVYQIKMK